MALEGIGGAESGVGAEIAGGLGLGAFAGIAGAIAGVGLVVGLVTSKVVDLASSFVVATAKALDFGQRSRLALGSLLGDEGKGAEQFDLIRKEAQAMGLDVMDTTDAFRKLLAAQFDVGTAHQLVRMTGDMQALGASSEDIKGTLLAISQIKMKGFLQAEELTGQLAEHGISAELVYKSLEKTLGKTRAQILKMQKGKQITAEMAVPAILEAVKKKAHEDEIGQTGLKFANIKISGMVGQVRGMIDNAFTDLGTAIEHPATDLAKTFFGTVQKVAQSPALAAARDKLVEVFKSAASWVETNWPRIEPMIIGAVNALAEGFTSAADFVQNHGEEMRLMLEGIGATASDLATIFVGITAAVYATAGAIFYARGIFEEFKGALGGFPYQAFKTALEAMFAPLILAAKALGFMMSSFGALAGMVGSSDEKLAIAQSKERLASLQGSGQLAGVGGTLAGLGASQLGIPSGIRSIGDVKAEVNVTGTDLSNPESVAEAVTPAVQRALLRALGEV